MCQHAGWKKINGEWAYLYHGGVVGSENVTVDLGYGLHQYSLSDYDIAGIPLEEAVRVSANLSECISEMIEVPLQAMMYLAPLRHFLDDKGIAPAFILYLLGETGSRKSAMAALALSHFGRFSHRSLPASFNDTTNKVLRSAHVLKDMPIVVDDYYTAVTTCERRRMDEMAQHLARAYGDLDGRGRMRADADQQADDRPRGVAIMTGESVPAWGESGSARCFVVHVTKYDVLTNIVLTDMQEKADKGMLRKAMRGYIQWLIPQVDELGEKLHRRWIAICKQVILRSNGELGRAPESIAHMILAYEMMLDYFAANGAIDIEGYNKKLAKAWSVLVAWGKWNKCMQSCKQPYFGENPFR